MSSTRAGTFDQRRRRQGRWPVHKQSGRSRSGSRPRPSPQLAREDAARETFERVRTSQAGRRMILGVDRLDYSKGLEERFLAYEQLLIDHPDCGASVSSCCRSPPPAATRCKPIRRSARGSTACPAASTAPSPRSIGCRSATSTAAHRRDELAGIYRRGPGGAGHALARRHELGG